MTDETGGDPSARIARRRGVVEALRDGPRSKPELVDRLSCSRSTVDRAIRELETVGWVRRTNGGYAVTLSGRLAAEVHDEYRRRLATVQETVPVLDPLPADAPLDDAVLLGASVSLPDGASLYEPGGPLSAHLEAADALCCLAPMGTDPRLFARLEDLVADGTAVDLVVGPDCYDRVRERIDDLRSTTDGGGRLTLATGPVPPFGLLVRDPGTDATAVVVVYDETGSPHGVVENDTAATREWARRLFLTHWTDATQVVPADRRDATPVSGIDATRPSTASATDAVLSVDATERDAPDSRPHGTGSDDAGVASTAVGATTVEDTATEPGTDPNDATATPPDGGNDRSTLSTTLRTEGFRLLSPAFFDRRTPVDPVTSLRAGIGLPEVAAGYAVDRTHDRDGERRDLTADLVAGLAGGTDHALVGPPGSGKSTVCKSVAYRWYEQGRGPVFYRESGTGRAFEARGELASELDAATGHALVVVEDAVRASANAVFEVMTEFAGDPTVTFLVDAREAEWRDPDDLPIDARLEAYRQDAVETVRMPGLSPDDVERLVDHVAGLVDEPLSPPDPAELLATVNDPDAEAGPDDLLVLFHRLALHLDPLADADGRAATALVEDVQRTYRDIQDADVSTDLVLDVATLVNLWNAAGMAVAPDLVAALGTADADDDADPVAVREALDLLSGRVVFEGDPGDDHLRTVHEIWSVQFLDHLLDEAGPEAAHRRVAHVVTTVLSLADDPDRRAAVERARQGASPTVDSVAADPETWATDTLERLFAIGRDTPALAPLYGRTGYSRIDEGLPDCCGPATLADLAKWRGEMYLDEGDLDVAEAEYAALADLAADVDDETRRTHLVAHSLERRGHVADRRGDLETARDLGERALERFRSIDDAKGEAESLNGIGVVDWLEGDLDAATECFVAARERYRSCNDRRGEANAVNNLGIIAWTEGDLDEAAEYFAESLDAREAIGDRAGIVDSCINLGVVARDAGRLDDAERWLRRALEVARDFGGREYAAHARRALGNVRRRQGDLDEAREMLETALERNREMENRVGEAHCLRSLGVVERLSGDLDAAGDYAERALAVFRDVGDDHNAALARRDRGVVARERGDVDAARTDLTASIEVLREEGREAGLAPALVHRALLDRTTGDEEAAREGFEAALSYYRSVGATPYALAVLDHLVECCRSLGDDDAVERYRSLRPDLVTDGTTPIDAF